MRAPRSRGAAAHPFRQADASGARRLANIPLRHGHAHPCPKILKWLRDETLSAKSETSLCADESDNTSSRNLSTASMSKFEFSNKIWKHSQPKTLGAYRGVATYHCRVAATEATCDAMEARCRCGSRYCHAWRCHCHACCFHCHASSCHCHACCFHCHAFGFHCHACRCHCHA